MRRLPAAPLNPLAGFQFLHGFAMHLTGGTATCTLASSSNPALLCPLLLHTIPDFWTCRPYETRHSLHTARRGMQPVPLSCKISVPSFGHGCTSRFFFFCPAFLTLADRLYPRAPKPNCGVHSWGVPHCHCPLEIRRPVALSLGDVATPATILL